MFVRTGTVKISRSLSNVSQNSPEKKLFNQQKKKKESFQCSFLAHHINAIRIGGLVLHQQRVKICVRGTLFETFESTLGNFPNTLLGNISKRNTYFDELRGAYVFDRCVNSFDAVLFYYQSKGTLAKPPLVTREQFYEELNFYEIDGVIDERHMEDLYFLKQNDKKNGDLPKGCFRSTVWKFVNFFNDNFLQTAYTYVNLLITLLSITAFCLETEPSLQFAKIWIYIEIGTGIFFGIEFIFFVYSCPNIFQLRRSLNALIDLASVIVNVVYIFLYFLVGNKVTVLIRFFRVIRVFKLTKFSMALRLFIYTLYKCSNFLQIILVTGGTLSFAFAAFIFILENQFNKYKEESAFRSIFDAMWYAVISATGVGYGDIHPTTALGKVCGAFLLVTGILLFCLPQPVLVNQFISVYYLPEIMCNKETLRKNAIMKMRQTMLGEV
ncbi:potassium voltage-gated channel subfamily A member 1 [Hydra vulgaris]|uniref:potassium voltage-gated channel subfamily A member 1 n=1 Tax=Hydra vulgaris TaxID=6087 RepID=UPI0001925877|nr:potassium voltage-gated channel subfamily A member 1-like [Hydra vulgaris]